MPLSNLLKSAAGIPHSATRGRQPEPQTPSWQAGDGTARNPSTVVPKPKRLSYTLISGENE